MLLFANLPDYIPYDNFEDHEAVIALRSGGEEVNNELEKEIRERLRYAASRLLKPESIILHMQKRLQMQC